jgi:hypothetical protein
MMSGMRRGRQRNPLPSRGGVSVGWIRGLACGALILGLAGPVKAFEPVIQVAVSTPSKPSISGTTNLPDGTPLMVSIEVAREDAMNPGHIIYPIMGQDAVAVHGGRFVAGPFTNGGSPYDRGTYIVSVVISSAALPDNVQPILGEMGEKMGGPNVKAGPFGPYFEIRESFEIR